MPITAGTTDVSIVIISFNTQGLLRECLESIQPGAGAATYETIVVDNASRDGSADMVDAEFTTVRLIRSATNLGFAAANNVGCAEARGRYVVQLNSDAFLHPGALEAAVRHMDSSPRVGLGGGRLIGRDGGWQPSARMFPSPLNEVLSITGLAAKHRSSRLLGRADRTWADPLESSSVDWVPGAFTIIRRHLFDELGRLDERFFLYFDDVDICRRIKALGYEVWYWPDIVVTHVGGESAKTVKRLEISSSGAQLTLWRVRSQLLYYRKYHGAIGAWLSMFLETSWNRLKMLRYLGANTADLQAKSKESQVVLAMLRQAWRETQGGQICPPRPW